MITPTPLSRENLAILRERLREQSYILVQWPESQDWISNKKAIFCGGSEDKTGDSAYFVPINLYINHLKKRK